MLSQIRAQIQRSTHRRLLHASPRAPYAEKHTTDTYAKEVDATPPPDNSVHRVDPDSDKVQKPHEPPSGEWSRAGTKTKEYETMENGESGQPYAPPGGEDRRYGGRNTYQEEKGPETSHAGEGPEGKEAGGRKAERTGRTGS